MPCSCGETPCIYRIASTTILTVTRESYISLAHYPEAEEWGAEDEMSLPEPLQRRETVRDYAPNRYR
jgi:hypothetical protein